MQIRLFNEFLDTERGGFYQNVVSENSEFEKFLYECEETFNAISNVGQPTTSFADGYGYGTAYNGHHDADVMSFLDPIFGEIQNLVNEATAHI